MTTRRNVLASAAAAALIPAAVTASPSPDAELIRLGQEFATAFAAFRHANGVWQAAEREIMAEWALKFPQGAGDTHLTEFWTAYNASPAAPASAENERRLDVCDAIAAQIRAIRPTTFAGLAAHANVARFDGFAPSLLAQDRCNLDCPQIAVLDFLDLVDGLAA
ncbi:hypothetical protein ABIE41_001466 [Bosea sp. OAE506]|uniref:hypothetical protein n=1 Tax=Bosea sp. OAE506 TaxID=2663870 RepID=UPI00178A726D